MRVVDDGVGDDDGAGVGAHGGVRQGAVVDVDVLGRGLELVVSQLDGGVGGEDLVVETGDGVAHVAGDEVVILAQVHLWLAAIGEELVRLFYTSYAAEEHSR